PWKGVNAIDRLIDGYLSIRELFPAVVPGDEWHNTMAAARIEGGTAHNRIPDEAKMTINIRYVDPAERETIENRIRELSGLELGVVMQCDPVVFAENTPEFAALAACMRESLKADIAFVRMNGATDARHFAQSTAPVAIIGAPGRDIHGNDEAVDIQALRQYEELLVESIRQLGMES
ncbi:MAG: M20/M25/M40 family metallo-hydrolase, partial [Victivallales bacterium]|nr:M20/M25/M40 family metallo-hydrolase [Victivallales bacterium]